ncbi:MAG: CsgG/HfaB family protein [Myxococcota bacterium]
MTMTTRSWSLAFVAVAMGLAMRLADARAAAPGGLPIAVLELVDASSDPGLEALGKGLQSMLTTDLSQVGAVTVIERACLDAILAEQQLAATGVVDPATASKVGKLAGAAYLLTGSYTVAGKSMRLDARLFGVTTGEVVLAESMTGERDAFFELEKGLVQKLVKALGVTLDPKERAGVAKIHTADFGAFKTFSQAVADFDAERYDQALEDLRQAMRMDADFGLARVTLDAYQAVVAKIRAKATSIELGQREVAALERDKDFQAETAIVQRLMAIADEKGDARRPRRLAALTFLIGLHNPADVHHGRVMRFQEHFDGLVLRRRAAGLARRYLAEALPIYPDAPPFTLGRLPPDDLAELDARVNGFAKALKQALELRPEDRDRGLLGSMADADGFAALMEAEPRERVDLLELAFAKLGALGARPDQRIAVLGRLADAYLEAGDLDAASGAWARASSLMSDADELQRTAARIEALGKLAAAIQRSDKAAALKELVAAGTPSEALVARFAAPGPPGRDILDALAESRDVERWFPAGDPFWFMAGEPAALLDGESTLTTGARSDRVHATDLRYYHPASSRTKDTLVALGRGARKDVVASFAVAFARAPDFWPRNLSSRIQVADLVLDPGRPEVTFVFGLIDVARPAMPDASGKSRYLQPTQAYGIRLGPDAVALVRLGEDAPSDVLRRPAMTVKVLSEAPSLRLDERAKSTPVRVEVHGTAVSVSVGGVVHAFTLPAAAEGFIGFHLRGQGYAAIEALKLD